MAESNLFDADVTIGRVDQVIGAVSLVERRIFFDEPQAEELYFTLQLALEKLQRVRLDLEHAPRAAATEEPANG